jgi:hypothetical protein
MKCRKRFYDLQFFSHDTSVDRNTLNVRHFARLAYEGLSFFGCNFKDITSSKWV